MPFIPNTDEDRKEMLASIGVENFEQLIANIPDELRFKEKINLPPPLSEMEITSHLHSKIKKNSGCIDYVSFLGGGAYDHYIPAAIDHIISRSEFYTAYTPYQPEVSQGTLQVIYEYQSMIAELMAMDVSNASLYDGASALAEAVLMAISETRKNKILISKAVNPFYRQVIASYISGQDVKLEFISSGEGVTDLDHLKKQIDNNTAAVVIQHPNFFGCLEDVDELEKIIHQHNALYITSNDPMSLAILEPPGNYNVDVATGEGQCFGNALNYGGPYLGILTTKEKFIRKMPGRIAGATVDTQGRQGFVLTYQTREQHIRRDKATSNICTNQALNALAATIYLALMGKYGLKNVATRCLNNSHYLADKIQNIDGFSLKYNRPFFKEFVIDTPVDPEKIIANLSKKRILAGINLNKLDPDFKNNLLIAVTEKRTKEEMDLFIDALTSIHKN